MDIIDLEYIRDLYAVALRAQMHAEMAELEFKIAYEVLKSFGSERVYGLDAILGVLDRGMERLRMIQNERILDYAEYVRKASFNEREEVKTK